MNDGDDELDALREERIRELQERQQSGQAQEEAQAEAHQQAEAQKQALLRQYLTDGARKRLNSVRMSRPDFAERVEQQLIALAQSGRVREKIDEEQMKQLLTQLSPESQSFNIKRR